MKEERIFLHDVSSPLTTVTLNLGNALEILMEKKSEDFDTCIMMIEKCIQQTKRATDMICARRLELEAAETK